MKAKEIFGLILRVVGLFSVLYGGFYLMSSLYCLTGVPERQGFGARQYFLAGGVYVVVGLYFLRGAPHLLRFAYGQEDSPSNPAPQRTPGSASIAKSDASGPAPLS